jgi:hypothetical protein
MKGIGKTGKQEEIYGIGGRLCCHWQRTLIVLRFGHSGSLPNSGQNLSYVGGNHHTLGNLRRLRCEEAIESRPPSFRRFLLVLLEPGELLHLHAMDRRPSLNAVFEVLPVVMRQEVRMIDS